MVADRAAEFAAHVAETVNVAVVVLATIRNWISLSETIALAVAGVAAGVAAGVVVVAAGVAADVAVASGYPHRDAHSSWRVLGTSADVCLRCGD